MLVEALLTAAAATSLLVVLVGAGHVIEMGVDEERPIGTPVGSVGGSPDVADLGADSALRFNFRFSSGPYVLFAIDPLTGDVRTARRIDREQVCPTAGAICSVELDVTVLPLKFYRILKVVVNVVDINDNSPSFPQVRISLEVKENSGVGSRVRVPPAVDADSGPLGVQRYELVDPSGVFRLEAGETSGAAGDVMLSLRRRLDRERRRSYSLTVTAYDGGTPPKSGTIEIQVFIN